MRPRSQRAERYLVTRKTLHQHGPRPMQTTPRPLHASRSLDIKIFGTPIEAPKQMLDE